MLKEWLGNIFAPRTANITNKEILQEPLNVIVLEPNIMQGYHLVPVSTGGMKREPDDFPQKLHPSTLFSVHNLGWSRVIGVQNAA